jgi:hypothetical protein
MKAGLVKKSILAAAVVVLAGVLASGSYWHFAAPAQTCLSCHEIQSAHDLWIASAHRNVKCDGCHGTALSNGFHSLWENGRRVVNHFSQSRHDDLRLSEAQVVEMVDRCKSCHEREFADWTASGHSARYSDIFLHVGHNQAEQLNADCLRCHGMFYEQTIEELVTPISITGPWRLLQADQGPRPVIPCLTCHEIHAQGSVAGRPDYANPRVIAADRQSRIPRISFYDRREKRHYPVEVLPTPRAFEGDRPLLVAPDPRQRICFQCHADVAFQKARVGDDRTPRGVHEGLSCFSCHGMHSLDARHSCSHCHPRLSNCGLDVEHMDTTFKSPESPHNVHFVTCIDCHPQGVPAKKAARREIAATGSR